mgnify:CR=1 FL=1
MNHLYSNLVGLYTRAKDTMSADELRELGIQLSESAENHSHDMNTVMEGIAGLVVSAGPDDGGRFQFPSDLTALLGMIGCQFELLSGMIHVASEAQWKAAELDRQAGKGGDHE